MTAAAAALDAFRIIDRLSDNFVDSELSSLVVAWRMSVALEHVFGCMKAQTLVIEFIPSASIAIDKIFRCTMVIRMGSRI